ncbi:MAG: thiamine diphosphokinase [Lachnospiraceae bacterium]|nr:thiamine diphosphokinase [Lachnospiraceae bacterium]
MQNNRRCVIVGGADIANYEYLRQELRINDFLIYCDSGLKHLERLKADPDLIVGDFDSHENPHLPVETIVLPREKDDTDTVFAAREGIRRGYAEFLLIGVVGERLDHTLGNVSILLLLDKQGKHGRIIDNYSEMELVGEAPVQIDGQYPFFSLLNISGEARKITVTGAKYPLSDAEITPEYAYGVSNEVLPGETAEVVVRNGRLLLIKVLP